MFYNKRSHHNKKSARHNERAAQLTATREKAWQQQRPSTAKNKAQNQKFLIKIVFKKEVPSGKQIIKS